MDKNYQITLDATTTTKEATERKTVEKTAEEILREAGLEPKTAPKIVLKLYPFQLRNVLSVQTRKVVLLAWQMGVGKTWGAGALSELWGDRILIVLGPKNVVDQWIEILKKETDRAVYNWYKKGDVGRFLADSRPKALCASDDAFWRESMANVRKYIEKNSEAVTMICDESSRLGDFRTKRTKAVLYTKCAHKILLSGTPASGGKLEKLRPQMKMLGWPMSKDEFFDNFAITEDKIVGAGKLVRKPIAYKNVEALRQGLIEHGASFISMIDAGLQLPETIDVPVTCTTPPEYKRLMRSGITSIEGDEIICEYAASRMIAARQLCSSYCTDKLNRLSGILEESAGERIIIFYNFKRDFEVLKECCEKLERPISYVNGQGKNLRAYENSNNSVTLCQYRSGSMGLNLQKSRICIFFGPCLSYTDLAQAKARVHRQGQKNGCVFYKMICKGSVEEKIYETLAQRGTYNKVLFAEQYGIPLGADPDTSEGGACA